MRNQNNYLPKPNINQTKTSVTTVLLTKIKRGLTMVSRRGFDNVLGVGIVRLAQVQNGVPSQDQIDNGNAFPIAQTNNPENALVRAGTSVINILFYVAGAIAIGYLIYHASVFITAQGDEGKIEQAKKGLLYSVLGIIVITLSIVIVNFIRTIL